MPASRPLVQTLVARKALARCFDAASRSPVTASARPYIGELSITLPPAANSASSTPGRRWYSALPGATSKPIQVPQPTTGRASRVEGMGRVFMRMVSWCLGRREWQCCAERQAGAEAQEVRIDAG